MWSGRECLDRGWGSAWRSHAHTHKPPEWTTWRCVCVCVCVSVPAKGHTHASTSIHPHQIPLCIPRLPLPPHSHPELKQQHYLIPALERRYEWSGASRGSCVSREQNNNNTRREEHKSVKKKNMKLALSPSFLCFFFFFGPDGLSHKLCQQLQRQSRREQSTLCSDKSIVLSGFYLRPLYVRRSRMNESSIMYHNLASTALFLNWFRLMEQTENYERKPENGNNWSQRLLYTESAWASRPFFSYNNVWITALCSCIVIRGCRMFTLCVSLGYILTAPRLSNLLTPPLVCDVFMTQFCRHKHIWKIGFRSSSKYQVVSCLHDVHVVRWWEGGIA